MYLVLRAIWNLRAFNSRVPNRLRRDIISSSMARVNSNLEPKMSAGMRLSSRRRTVSRRISCADFDTPVLAGSDLQNCTFADTGFRSDRVVRENATGQMVYLLVSNACPTSHALITTMQLYDLLRLPYATMGNWDVAYMVVSGSKRN